MYLRGEGLARDYAQAANWFRSAAERGYAPAQEDLAWMYYTGAGLAVDNQQAALWARMAAEQGYAQAQLDLGYLYEQGRGVSLDYVAAYMWYKAAADRGEKRGELQLKKLSSLLTPDQVQRANADAAKLTDSLPKLDMGNGLASVGGLFPRH